MGSLQSEAERGLLHPGGGSGCPREQAEMLPSRPQCAPASHTSHGTSSSSLFGPPAARARQGTVTRPFLQRLDQPGLPLGNHNARPSPVTAPFIFPNTGRQTGQGGPIRHRETCTCTQKVKCKKTAPRVPHSSSLKHQIHGNGYLNNSSPLVSRQRVPAASGPAWLPPSRWPARYWRNVGRACSL